MARARQRVRFDQHDIMDDRNGDVATNMKSTRPDPERQAFTRELRTLLETAIDELPAPYRAVFVMRDVEGMSTAESAACLEITEEAAKQRLHRARLMLRETLYERAGIANVAAFSFEAPRCDRIAGAVLAEIDP